MLVGRTRYGDDLLPGLTKIMAPYATQQKPGESWDVYLRRINPKPAGMSTAEYESRIDKVRRPGETDAEYAARVPPTKVVAPVAADVVIRSGDSAYMNPGVTLPGETDDQFFQRTGISPTLRPLTAPGASALVAPPITTNWTPYLIGAGALVALFIFWRR